MGGRGSMNDIHAKSSTVRLKKRNMKFLPYSVNTLFDGIFFIYATECVLVSPLVVRARELFAPTFYFFFKTMPPPPPPHMGGGESPHYELLLLQFLAQAATCRAAGSLFLKAGARFHGSQSFKKSKGLNPF